MFTVQLAGIETKIHNIDDVRRANSAAGQNWFSAENIRYFGTRIHRTMHGRYFVTSEFAGYDLISRAYTIRRVEEDATITTVGEFIGYTTGREAHERAKLLAKEDAKSEAEAGR